MKVLLVIDQSNKIFINSFTDAFSLLELDFAVFIADESNYKVLRQKLARCIQKENITELLMLNDLNNGQEFFLTDPVFQKVNCYLWFLDTIHSVKLCDQNFNKYKKVFSFEPKDVIDSGDGWWKRKIEFLPLTAGTKIFCSNKCNDVTKKYDICFVGLVRGSAKRMSYLDAVANYCNKNNRKMIVYGYFWHIHHFYQSVIGCLKFRYMHPNLYKFIKNRYLSPAEAAELYRQTRINLNIHVDNHNHTGCNCRTFEILGNGNFELCDARDLTGIKLRDGKELVFYGDEKDLICKLDYYLKHDKERERIAEQGRNFVNRNYSFADSIRKIFMEDNK